jgi:superfamily II DNA or RNA helicase/HKD family nuclease
MTGTVPEGAYDQVVTSSLLERLLGLHTATEPVEEAEAAERLGELVGRLTARHLADLPHAQRVDEVNRLLAALGVTDTVTPGPERLMAAARQEAPGVWRLVQVQPQVPLSRPALLTNTSNDPKLGPELRAELATADRVDLLCAFVKWYGLRVLEDALAERRDRGVPLRVLTTTYMGATDRTALDRLVREFGAQVRISYETRSTRLHAKAWLFRRDTGFDTAYVGSSNLSRAALLDGLEWNVRLAGSHTPELLAKFEATFDSYWESSAFTPYDPDTDGPLLDEMLAVAGGGRSRDGATYAVSGLEVRALPHQRDILEQLQVEREVHDRHRNLVVAATGTGKTVVAALDYKSMTSAGKNPSLLFVAHRKEILEQSLRTYREVLADGAFGELYVGGERPERWRHVFASVQSLSAYGIERLPADAFDVVVVDEFHHAEAATYRRILDHLRPVELLGLTATPERADGVDVRDFFGGRTAAELRLWEALEADLLCPFHYFGVADPTDLSQLEWRRGDYDTAALERVLTADDVRVRVVLRHLRDKVADVTQMRALGFCVSVAHARFMAERFEAAGIPARAVTGDTPAAERRAALSALQTREVNVLFAVDIFNEGVDLPDVDTLLLLRPTQSATVFLQQLGRGLRRTDDKPVLTVLDFIGQQARQFRFDLKYRALTGASRRQLERHIENGFPYLPSGCELVLDAVAQRTVLENVRRQLRLSRKELVAEVRSHGDLDLATWLGESGRELADVFRSNGSWTALRRAASLPTPDAGPNDEALLRRVSALAHVDDAERAAAYDALLRQPVDVGALADRDQRYARMLFFSLWPNGGGFSSYQEGFDALWMHPAVRAELREVIALGLASAEHVALPLEAGMQQVTLRTHARYSREEVLAALDYASLSRRPNSFMSGVVWSEPAATDAFFVTLRKTEQHFSPTTMYRDFALSEELFHWESQNATSVESPVGRRYLNHRAMGTHVLLLTRPTRANDWGGTAPFTCLGPATYVSHQGDRPIAITWRLRHRLPPALHAVAAVTA